MSNNPVQHQQHFFQLVESVFASKADMVAAVSQDLQISANAAYRRVNGSTALSATEMLVLANKYHLDLNFTMTADDDRAALFQTNTPAGLRSEVDFFKQAQERLSILLTLTEGRFKIVTPELPMGWELLFPTLRDFKIYTYGSLTWGFDRWNQLPFTPDLIHPDAKRYADEYVRTSFKLRGTLLLSPKALDVTLEQIVYLAELGRMADQCLIKKLFSELHQLVDHLERLAKDRQRYLPGETAGNDQPAFFLYKNEIPTNRSIMLLTAVERSIVIVPEMFPDTLVTVNPRVVNKSLKGFEALEGSATLLGPSATKQTQQFFTRLRTKIDTIQNRLQKQQLFMN